MALIKLQFKPGINRDQTDYTGEGGWWAADKIRFLSGSPQKIGGWTKVTPNTFLGTCRQMWNWVTSYTDNFLALGTNLKLYIETGGYFYDITPLRETLTTPDTDNSIQTDNGSTTVVVNLATAHGAESGSYVTISGVTGDVGGIPDAEINANHEITVIDTDSFSFTVSTTATSTVAAGGGTAITMEFEIEPGFASATYGYGWGTGTWGRDAWGLGSSAPIVIPQRDWWLDNFDNDLVANIRNGAIYYWERGTNSDPTSALETRAVPLQDIATDGGYDPNAVPVKVMQTLVSQQDKHLIAFGAVPFGSTDEADFDPLLIRWADQDNPGQWEPEPANSAGFLRISRGSRIIRALPARQEILVWSDSNLYTLQFLATPDNDVFGLQEYADNISMASPRACAAAGNNVIYWMGLDKFYSYSGRVDTVSCTLRNHVFQNLNYDQAAQIICGTNEEWNEVWWFYPSADSNWNNKYVVLNYLDPGNLLWYYGDMERTAWLDTSLKLYPQACTTAEGATMGTLYNHEDGIDADEEPLSAYIQSNDFDIGDGEQFMLSRRIIPDISLDGSTAEEPEVTVEIRARNFPGSTLSDDAEDSARVISTTVDTYTNQVFIRARARQMAFKIMSENLGVQWQLGSPRLDARTDGKR